jgi:hypothetical protein
VLVRRVETARCSAPIAFKVSMLVSISTWFSRAKFPPCDAFLLTTAFRKKRSRRFFICGTSIAVPNAPAPTSA